MVWDAGQQLEDGKYTIVKSLGVGGFGTTYLAQKYQSYFVVIKTLSERLKFDPNFEKFQKYFLKEASALARCNHPHIVKFYEIIRVDDFPCIVMEYIPGENLYTIVTKHSVLPENQAVQIITQIGDALSTLHQQGFLHGDVTPHNIILRSNTSEAVLVDFGISRKFISNSTDNSMGLSIGYSPPEQYTTNLRRGPYTDVYGLAATLYFLLTESTPISSLDRIAGKLPLTAPKDINKHISYGINFAILKGMELTVEHRPKTVEAWINLLNSKPPKLAKNPQRELQIFIDRIIRISLIVFFIVSIISAISAIVIRYFFS
ncbi:serine/threonine protein kinase [Nostoc sp. CHAB 5844]|nr:serine/threonine protein kinase [Nostoc sp. CHAB 5844]